MHCSISNVCYYSLARARTHTRQGMLSRSLNSIIVALLAPPPIVMNDDISPVVIILFSSGESSLSLILSSPEKAKNEEE